MCIVNLKLQDHPRYKLIIAANRDEFLKRPTAEAQFWQDKPNILAGRDLEAKGTWLGITKTGKFAALTNFRNPQIEVTGKTSRGEIVTNFLTGNMTALEYLQDLRKQQAAYNGYNVIAGTVDELFYYGNQQADIIRISPGVHSVSNHLLNTAWPKVTKAKEMLTTLTKEADFTAEDIFTILGDKALAADSDLPETGVPLELERKLSSIFITMPDYGTRSSAVILVTHDDHIQFIERTYQPNAATREVTFSFQREKSA